MRLVLEICARYRCSPEKGGLAGSSGEVWAGGGAGQGKVVSWRSCLSWVLKAGGDEDGCLCMAVMAVTHKVNYFAILPLFPLNDFWRELCREAGADVEASRWLWVPTVAGVNSLWSCTNGCHSLPIPLPFVAYSLFSPCFFPLSKSVYRPEENREGIDQLPGADGAVWMADTQKAELLSPYLPFAFSSKALRTKEHQINMINQKLKHRSMEEIVREPLVDLNDSKSSDPRE